MKGKTMDLKRRSFLKLVGLGGIAFVTPGLTIADIIPKTGQKNAAQTIECKDFGEFLVSVVDNKGEFVSMPKRFAGILGRTAKKAGILGRLKREILVVPLYASEELLEDCTALGHMAWHQLNEEILHKKPKLFERFSNNTKELQVRVVFLYDESAFKFVIRAT